MRSPTQQLHQRNQELALINEASQAFNSTLDLAHVLQTILEKMHSLLDITGTSLWLLDEDTGELVCHHATGPEHAKVIGWRLPPSQGLSWHAIQAETAIITPDTRAEARHYEKVDQHAGLEFRAIMNFPLKVKGRVIGVLNLVDTQAGRFSEEDLRLLTPVMTSAAAAIENARLFKSQQHAKDAALEAQKSAESARRAAETANQAKSAFLANMSHELRTPLNVILGFAQVMANNPRSPKDQEYLAAIQRSGNHLLTLINQVLDLSKIEAGRMTLNETDFDLHSLLADLVDLFAIRANQKNLSLDLICGPDVPRCICADEVKLRQILINLLNNAVKFTSQGGVTVKIFDLRFEIVDFENPQAASSNQKSQIKNLKFQVSDTGPGIAPDELTQVFEAFVQTTTGRASQEGTGLGLPISRKFAQLMGGDITVASQVGQGTTLTVTIRVKPVDQAVGAVRQAPPLQKVMAIAPGQPRYRILIVDDLRDNRQVLVELLKPFGFDVREAENGQAAVTIWQDWLPDLIFMDMRMPVLDGYEATREIRRIEVERFRGVEDEKQAHIPIVALTASSYHEQRAEILAAGCDDYVRKPFQVETIFGMLRQHIGVEFVYAPLEPAQDAAQDRVSPGTAPESPRHAALTPDMVAELPDDVLDAIAQAAGQGNTALVKQALQTIRAEHVAVADAFATLVQEFDYGRIVELIRAARKP